MGVLVPSLRALFVCFIGCLPLLLFVVLHVPQYTFRALLGLIHPIVLSDPS
jgi:hypothetical protein